MGFTAAAVSYDAGCSIAPALAGMDGRLQPDDAGVG